jgi:hypothetical protein
VLLEYPACRQAGEDYRASKSRLTGTKQAGFAKLLPSCHLRRH